MREILFRGKRTDNSEWVEGYFCGKVNETIFLPATESAQIIDKDLFWHEVIPETVGQYTGLSDSKGRKIFEGDIVKGHLHSAWSHNIEICDIAYGKSGFESRMHINGLDSDYYSHKVLFSKDVEVIGSIYDNPELLSGEVKSDV